MTKPTRTLEEIARELRNDWGNKPGIDVDAYIAAIVAALREAADAARQEEREAIRVEADDGLTCDVYDGYHQPSCPKCRLLAWLDARPKP